MAPLFLLCPRCGAKNPADAARCYACAASLESDDALHDEIPDPLLDNAARAVREEPPKLNDSGERMGIAVAATLGILAFSLLLPIIVLLIAPWVYIPLRASPLLAFLSYLGMIALAIVGLWVWAIGARKR